MASRRHTLYIGMTGDLRRRVFQHKAHEKDGFVDRYDCDRLVRFQEFGEPSAAIGRKKELNGRLRRSKIALIEETNPTWQDLSRDCYEYEPAHLKRALGRMDR